MPHGAAHCAFTATDPPGSLNADDHLEWGVIEPCMTEIYLHFLCAHYGLYGNESLTPCDAQVVAAGPAPAGSALERQKRAVAVAGVRAFFQMVLRDNFVHADLHPGNIFVRGWQGKQRRHVNS